jgi:hypothetical protein
MIRNDLLAGAPELKNTESKGVHPGQAPIVPPKGVPKEICEVTFVMLRSLRAECFGRKFGVDPSAGETSRNITVERCGAPQSFYALLSVPRNGR